MKKIDLSKYGICDVKEIVYNPSYDLLFEEEMRKDFGLFMDDYIAYVYSKTSQKEPNKEDYCCFWSFDEMRKLLNDFDGLAPVAKKVYSEYRDYIMTKK